MHNGLSLPPPRVSQRLIPGVLLPQGRFAWWYPFIGTVLMVLGLLAVNVLKDDGAQGSVGFLTYLRMQSQGIIFILAAVLTPVLATRRVWSHDFPVPNHLWNWRAGMVVLITVVMQIVVQLFEHTVAGAEEASKTVARSLGLGQRAGLDAAVVLAVTVMAPLGEELLFRGLIFRSLRDGLARWLPIKATSLIAIALSSAAFAGVHGGEGQDTQWPALFLMGALMALAYEWTGSMLAPMMVHSINNTLAMAQAISLPGVQPSADWINYLLWCSPLIVFMVGFALLRLLPRGSTPPPFATPQFRVPMP